MMLSNRSSAVLIACLALGAFPLGACDPLVTDPVTGGSSTQTTSAGTTSGGTDTSSGSSSSTASGTPSGTSQSTSAGSTTTSSSTSTGASGNLVTGFAWDLVAPGTGGTVASMANGGACVNANAGAQVILAWPQPGGSQGVTLSSGTSYTFSYSANASQQMVSVDAKVGMTTSPYTADVESMTDMVGTSMTPFSHAITGKADASAGIAFTFTSAVAQMVCFQNVSIVPN